VKHRRNILRALTAAVVLAAIVVGTGGTAQALVSPFDVQQLTEASRTVVVAQVVSVRSHWTAGAQPTIVTDVELRVGQVLKGSVGSSLGLRLPGGRVGPAAVLVSDAPQLFAGQTYVLFLDAGGNIVDGRLGAPQVTGGQVPALGDSVAGVAAHVAQLAGRSPLVLCSLRATDPAAAGAAAVAPAGSRAGAPVVTGVSPRRVAAGVGARITIAGSGFGMVQGLGRVLFFTQSGQPGLDARIVSWSDTSIVCRVPIGSIGGADAPSSGPLHVVTNEGQTSNEVPFNVVFSFDRTQWAVSSSTFRVDRRFPARVASVVAATQTWNAAGAPFQFVDGGTCGPRAVLGDGHNDIVWSTGLPAGYSAVTSTYTVGSSIIEADTKLNSSVKWGDATADSSATDVQTIVLHELGHWLGLRDLYGKSDAGKVMYGIRAAGDAFRSLAPADRAGELWIYQSARWDRTPPTTTLRPASGTSQGSVRLDFKVVDPPYSCGAAKVTVFVKQGSSLVPWVTFDGVPTGVWQHRRFKCTLAAGAYRFTTVATDMAGNKQVGVKFKTLTVQ
jgi:hypothetical protein